jgi:hypothetical protein
VTEGEWLASTDLAALLRCEEVRGRTRRLQRRLRLFSCACARQLEPWFKNPRLLKALDASERYADGFIKDAGIGKWNAETNKLWRAADQSRVRDKVSVVTAHWAVAYSCMAEKYGGYQDIAWRILQVDRAFREKKGELLALFLATLRDIFGNPFRPVALSPDWRTESAVAVARQIYEVRDFAAMPILADALQDAGCENDLILAHCRDPNQVHVRGCWAVDLLLANE